MKDSLSNRHTDFKITGREIIVVVLLKTFSELWARVVYFSHHFERARVYVCVFMESIGLPRVAEEVAEIVAVAINTK
ncbi:MAG: hypothetical protein ACRCW3_00325 [Metamycoplasmataceae bacterium]